MRAPSCLSRPLGKYNLRGDADCSEHGASLKKIPVAKIQHHWFEQRFKFWIKLPRYWLPIDY